MMEPRDLVDEVTEHRPHVVILGAGASRAACPSGDANGTTVPVMNDLAEVIGWSTPDGLTESSNFESLYAALVSDPARRTAAEELETKVRQFFEGLRLPDHVTVYDHLVLALRSKDVIATFNWDPFLAQAVRRVHLAGQRPPELVFLHGNVAVGYCHDDKRFGPVQDECSVCEAPYHASRLLYPIGDKDYVSDLGIAEGWRFIADAMRHAFMITVFGYSAPVSDEAAMQLLRNAWGEPSRREFEQVEIIDIRSEDELAETWRAFIHTHHYEIHKSFYESTLGLHPRRTGEAFRRQYLDGQWVKPNPVPSDLKLEDLPYWYGSLRAAETRHG